MGLVTVQRINDTYCIEHRLQAPERYHEEEAEKLRNELTDCFLPVMVSEEDGEGVLQCTAKGLISLSEFQQRTIDKQSFMEIVVQMVMVIRIGEQHGLSVHNYDMDYNRIFIEPESLKLYFIYWPVSKPRMRAELGNFFREMAFTTIFSRNEDNRYVSRYIQFFRQGDLFSLANFEEMIMLLANDEVEREDNISHQSNQLHEQQAFGETTALDPIFWAQALSQAKNKTKPQQYPQAYTQATLVNSLDETMVLTPELMNFTYPFAGTHKAKPVQPYLIRESRGERIVISKSVFSIGKENTITDYTVNNNKTISRRHASIVTKNGRYFIVDHGSTNYTYVNGKRIPSETEIEIFSGTKLKLSDEKFVFYTS